MLSIFDLTKTCLFLICALILLQSCTSVQFTQNQVESATQIEILREQVDINVLAFSKTAGFRHDSIEAAQQFLQESATERGWTIEATEDSSTFTDDNLANYDVVVFLSTTGDVLDDNQQLAFERFIQNGGGFAGVHAASDTEYDWGWYNGLIGAHFLGHPPIQTADILLADNSHPSTRFLPCRWSVRDEWYNFRTNPADTSEINILLWLDESTYFGGTMGDQHPIAWAREYDGGRSWYTAAGHRSDLFTSANNLLFQQHVVTGIEWAAGWKAPANSESGDNDLTSAAYLPAITTERCTP